MVTNEKCSETDLVNPQLAHNDVVHCGGDLSPHIVVPAGVELQVNGTWGGTGTKGYKRKEISLLPICNCRPESDVLKSVCENGQFYLQQLKNTSPNTFPPISSVT